ASDEIVGEIGAPAEADANPAGKMPMDIFDRANVHRVRKHQKFVLWVLALLPPPRDDFLAGRDGRRAVGTKAGPAGNPFRRIAQEGLGAEGVGKRNQKVAAIGVAPLTENAIGRPP